MTATFPLPAHALRIADLRPLASGLRRLSAAGIEVAVRTRTGDGLAGERVDVIELPDRRALVVLIDAHGPGEAAHVLAARLLGHVRSWAKRAFEPGGAGAAGLDPMVRGLDATVRGFGPGAGVASLLLLLVDAARHTVRAACAGIPGPIVGGRAGFVSPLAERGPALGLAPDVRRQETFPVRLSPEHVLVAATDGIVDAVGDDGVTFGLDRTAAVLAEHRGEGPRAVARILFRAASDWAGPADVEDRTVVAIRVK